MQHLQKEMHGHKQVTRYLWQKFCARMLRNAPEQSIVFRQGIGAPKLPNQQSDGQRHQQQRTPVRWHPMRPVTLQMFVQEPQGNEWMNVDQRQAEYLGRKPVESAQSESDRHHPGSIAARFLFGSKKAQ